MSMPLILLFGHLADRFPYAHRLTLLLDLFFHLAVYANLGMHSLIYNSLEEERLILKESSSLLRFWLPMLRQDPIFYALSFGAICRHNERRVCTTARLSHRGARIMRGVFMQQLGTTLGNLFSLMWPLQTQHNILLICIIFGAAALMYTFVRFRDNEDYADYSPNCVQIDRYVQSCMEEYREFNNAVNASTCFMFYTYLLITLLLFSFVASSVQNITIIAVYLRTAFNSSMYDVLWMKFSRNVMSLIGITCFVSKYWISKELAMTDVFLVLLASSAVLVEFSLYILLYVFVNSKTWILFLGTMFAFFSLPHKSILLAKLSREIESTYSRPRTLILAFSFAFSLSAVLDTLEIDFVSDIFLTCTELWSAFLFTTSSQIFVLLVIILVLVLYYRRELVTANRDDYYRSVKNDCIVTISEQTC